MGERYRFAPLVQQELEKERKLEEGHVCKEIMTKAFPRIKTEV